MGAGSSKARKGLPDTRTGLVENDLNQITHHDDLELPSAKI
jgi:hypothetical protein